MYPDYGILNLGDLTAQGNANAVGVVVIDTGYWTATPPDPHVQVIHHDFRPYASDKDTDWGPPIRNDGTDSVTGGRGAVTCDLISGALAKSPVSDRYRVFSLKAGDTPPPLNGVDVWSILGALDWSMGLASAYPTWRWVIYLNWSETAIGQVRSLLDKLGQSGISLVIPAGANNLNNDILVSRGDTIASYYPSHVFSVTNTDGDGNFFASQPTWAGQGRGNWGPKTVDVAIQEQNDWRAAAVGAAWVAASRLAMPDATAGEVVNHVRSLVTHKAALNGKIATGGMLTGNPHS